MEELEFRRTLADSLPGPDAGAARGDVLARARTMAAMTAGTRGTADGFDAARRRRGLLVGRVPWWLARLEAAAPALAMLSPAGGAAADIAYLLAHFPSRWCSAGCRRTRWPSTRAPWPPRA